MGDPGAVQSDGRRLASLPALEIQGGAVNRRGAKSVFHVQVWVRLRRVAFE